MPTQLSLFAIVNQADESVIMQVAYQFGFSIQSHVLDDDTQVYAVQDWLKGISQTESVRNLWAQFKKRLTKAGDTELLTRCSQLPYQAANGKTYQMDYADDITLFEMTGRLDTSTGVRNAVLQYMAKSAAFVDKLRLNKRDAAAMLTQMADDEDSARGKDATWIAAREKGIQTRNRFTKVLVDHNPDVNIGQATNHVYQGVFGMKASELRDMLHLKARGNPRDHMSRVALIYVELAEAIAEIELAEFKDTDIVPLSKIYRIVSLMAKKAGVQAADMAHDLGIDLLTGQKLLPRGLTP